MAMVLVGGNLNDLSNYEQQRQRNIDANEARCGCESPCKYSSRDRNSLTMPLPASALFPQAMLNALGLGNTTPIVPLRSNLLVPYEQRKPYVRKTYEVDELRQASLRDRQPKQKAKNAGLRANARAARSSRAAKRAALAAMGPVSRDAAATSSQLVVRKQASKAHRRVGMLDRPAGQRGGWNASATCIHAGAEPWTSCLLPTLLTPAASTH